MVLIDSHRFSIVLTGSDRFSKVPNGSHRFSIVLSGSDRFSKIFNSLSVVLNGFCRFMVVLSSQLFL